MFQANNDFPTEEGRREINPIQPLPTQNFINPDEALFSSANYPRDEFGRKILPGQQLDKLDFQQSVGNFYLESRNIEANSGDSSFKYSKEYVFPKGGKITKHSWIHSIRMVNVKEDWITFEKAGIELGIGGSFLITFYMNFSPAIESSVLPVVYSLFSYNTTLRGFVSIPWFLGTGFFASHTGSASSISRVLNLKKWDILLPKMSFPVELKDDRQYVWIANYIINITKLR